MCARFVAFTVLPLIKCGWGGGATKCVHPIRCFLPVSLVFRNVTFTHVHDSLDLILHFGPNTEIKAWILHLPHVYMITDMYETSSNQIFLKMKPNPHTQSKNIL